MKSVSSLLNAVAGKIDLLDTRLAEQQKIMESEKIAIENLKKKFRDRESDVKMNMARIKKSEGKLRSIKNNREYQALLKEIDDLKAKNSHIEDEMLEDLEAIEKSEEVLRQKTKKFTEFSKQIENEKKRIAEETRHHESRLAQLEKEYNRALGKVEAPLLEKFIKVKEIQRDRVAIAAVVDAVCNGCNVNIPPQMFNELYRSEKLEFCPNCQRIIYWVKETEKSA
jgi:predicted  nucleic acid-binding Zn-ribbon protein